MKNIQMLEIENLYELKLITGMYNTGIEESLWLRVNGFRFFRRNTDINFYKYSNLSTLEREWLAREIIHGLDLPIVG